MCNCLLCHRLDTKELRLSNISELLLYVSLVSVFSSYSVSLSDKLHTSIDDEKYTGNSYLLSRSDDDLIMDIFIVL